jgi:hypothetical protein
VRFEEDPIFPDFIRILQIPPSIIIGHHPHFPKPQPIHQYKNPGQDGKVEKVGFGHFK